MRLRTNTGYVERRVNLTGFNNPRLEFYAKINSFEAGDQAIVRVSPNGTTWTMLKTFTNADSTSYTLYAFDLNAVTLSNNFRIAFMGQMNATNDQIYIDDVNVLQRTP